MALVFGCKPNSGTTCGAYGFVHARTHGGRSFRVLTLVDELTRECLSIDVARQLNREDVLERLAWLMVTRGVTDHIRSDNGPAFTAKPVREWLKGVGVKTLSIEPGSPCENGYVEIFNGRQADELLTRAVPHMLAEAKVLIERWRVQYNTIRRHSSLGYRPPAPEGIQTWPPDSGATSLMGAGQNPTINLPKQISIIKRAVPMI